MRRSEALNIIWDAINELEDGDHILQKLEKAGMLPPPRESIQRTLDGKYLGRVVEYTWEPEKELEEDYGND